MHSKVHVFVATTKGLVAIQSIQHLPEHINSVVSVNHSTEIAQISHAYQDFVGLGSGVIARDFGHSAYRVNISHQIDQGQSWHLGFYIAHMLFEQQSLGDGKPKSGDQVLICSGQLDSTHNRVTRIEHLAQKMQLAQSQLAQWQSKNIMIEWVLPLDNRQNTKDGTRHAIYCTDLNSLYAQSYQAGWNQIARCPVGHSSTVSDSAKLTTFAQARWWTLGLLVCGTLILGAIFISQYRFVELHVFTSDSTCADGQYTKFSYPLERSPEIIPPSVIEQTCQIELITSMQTQAVWLVSTNQAVLPLNSRKQSWLHNHWTVPLPNHTQTERQYFLVLSKQQLDLADLASFKHWLAVSAIQGQISLEDISQWFNQQAYSYQIVTQKLYPQ